MDVDEDFFWRDLRKKIASAESERELQDAEADLRELECELAAETQHESMAPELSMASELSMAPELIDKWVARALASDGQEAGDGDTSIQAATRSPSRRVGGWQGWLAAAAALMVTPKFLVAATVVAGIAVTGALLQRSTVTLPFEHAINLLIDAAQSESKRAAAGGRVYFDVVESVILLQDLADSDTAMAQVAHLALAQLKLEMQQPTPFVHSRFHQPLAELGDRLAASDAGLAIGEQCLTDLVTQVTYGIHAMQMVQASNGPSALVESNLLHLQQIEGMLTN